MELHDSSQHLSRPGADGGDRSGRSGYHAFVLKGEKRYGSGLTFLSLYVFSKTFSLRSDRANAGDGRAMNHFNRDLEKGLSAFDQAHVIKLCGPQARVTGRHVCLSSIATAAEVMWGGVPRS